MTAVVLLSPVTATSPKVCAAVAVASLATMVRLELTVTVLPPVTPLADWAHAKLGIPEEEARQVAWGIAIAIKRRGTKGAHMFGQAYEANAAQVARIFDKHMSKALGRLH